jgi:hypothetical protein
MAAPPASMAPPLLPPTNDRATHHRTHRRRLGRVCAHLQGRRPAASPLPATATAAAVTSPARSSSGQRPVASQLATAQPPWPAIDVEFAQAAAIGQHSGAANPLARLSRGDVPAVILRQAMPPRECAGLIRRFAERGLLPEPFVPFISPELGLSEALARHAGDGAPGTGGSRWVGLEETGQDPSAALAERLDIGTALGNLGGDQPSFFEDAARSRTLYSTLFDELPTHPVELMYGALSKLSGGRKQVLTAREPDGREYCPTIYRSHMPEYGYAPHIDSVRHRERRTDYEVFRFGSQLGGILLLHAPVRRPLDGEGRTPGYTPPSDQYHDSESNAASQPASSQPELANGLCSCAFGFSLTLRYGYDVA